MNARDSKSTTSAGRGRSSPLVMGAWLATGVLVGVLARGRKWPKAGLLFALGGGILHLLTRKRPPVDLWAHQPVFKTEPLSLPERSETPRFWCPAPVAQEFPLIDEMKLAFPNSRILEVAAEPVPLQPQPLPFQPLNVWQSLVAPSVDPVSLAVEAEVAAQTAAQQESLSAAFARPAPVEPSLPDFAFVQQPAAPVSPPPVESLVEPRHPVVVSAPVPDFEPGPSPVLEPEVPASAIPEPEPEPVAEPASFPLAEAPLEPEVAPEPILFPELAAQAPEPVLAHNAAWLLGLEPLPVIHPDPVWPQPPATSLEGAVLPDEIEIFQPESTVPLQPVTDPELAAPSPSLLGQNFAEAPLQPQSRQEPVAPRQRTGPMMPPPAPAMSMPAHTAVRPVIKPLQPSFSALPSAAPRASSWLDSELARKPIAARRPESSGAPHRRAVPMAPATADAGEISASKKAWLNWWK